MTSNLPREIDKTGWFKPFGKGWAWVTDPFPYKDPSTFREKLWNATRLWREIDPAWLRWGRDPSFLPARFGFAYRRWHGDLEVYVLKPLHLVARLWHRLGGIWMVHRAVYYLGALKVEEGYEFRTGKLRWPWVRFRPKGPWTAPWPRWPWRSALWADYDRAVTRAQEQAVDRARREGRREGKEEFRRELSALFTDLRDEVRAARIEAEKAAEEHFDQPS